MQTGKWLSYGDLAWTEPLLAPPCDYAEENESYVNLIRKHSRIEAATLLHLACGAGGNDFTFKEHFTVTGVDISRRMLEIARDLNPEVTYVHDDMRSVDLQERFDAVAIPDSIDYMTTLADLKLAVDTACKHLKPGGVLLLVAKTREEFRENNFCYSGASRGVEVTVFENNHVPLVDRSSYEATIIYLIRRDGELSIYTDRHVLGLFSQSEWTSCLTAAGLEVRQEELKGIYDRFILGEGQYPMRIFIGVKPV
ncbi:MAG: class I SAM-dependent methyltransferase [Lysobacterales bacterium]|jgi:SAM-dependent methyltransferase